MFTSLKINNLKIKDIAFFIYFSFLFSQIISNAYAYSNSYLTSIYIVDDSVSTNKQLPKLINARLLNVEADEKFNLNTLGGNTILIQGETYGINPINDNQFIALMFNSKLVPAKYNSKTLRITVLFSNQNKLVSNKQFIWFPNYDGNLFKILEVEDKFLTCFKESSITVKVLDDITKAPIGQATYKFDSYCPTD